MFACLPILWMLCYVINSPETYFFFMDMTQNQGMFICIIFFWMSIWMIICSFAHARYMRAACRRLIHEGRQASACCMYVCVCVNEQKQPSTTMRSNRNSLRGTCTSLLYFVLKSCEEGGVVSLVSNTHAHIIRWHTRLSWELWSHDRTTSCSLWRYRNNPEYLYTLVK